MQSIYAFLLNLNLYKHSLALLGLIHSLHIPIQFIPTLLHSTQITNLQPFYQHLYLYLHLPSTSSTMKFTTALPLALPLLASAAPASDPTPNPNFSVMAARSASPIHYLQLNAAGQKFYLGGETASYCPDQVPNCPPGNQTIFTPGGASLVSPSHSHPMHIHKVFNLPQEKTPH